jgi:hypothetical protein
MDDVLQYPLFLQCHTHTKDVLHFVYSLRAILRRCSHVCASVGLPPYMSADSWGGAGWLNKLSWFFDASMTLSGFSGERKGIFRYSDWLMFFNVSSRTLFVAYIPFLSRISPHPYVTGSPEFAVDQRQVIDSAGNLISFRFGWWEGEQFSVQMHQETTCVRNAPPRCRRGGRRAEDRTRGECRPRESYINLMVTVEKEAILAGGRSRDGGGVRRRTGHPRRGRGRASSNREFNKKEEESYVSCRATRAV